MIYSFNNWICKREVSLKYFNTYVLTAEINAYSNMCV